MLKTVAALVRKPSPELSDRVFLKLAVIKPPLDLDVKSFEKADHFFQSLSLPKGQSLSFEIISLAGEILLVVVCPASLKNLIVKRLHEQYPFLLIREIQAPKVISKGRVIQAAELVLQKNYQLPIRTYKSLDTNLLKNLFETLLQLSRSQASAVQLVLSSAKAGFEINLRLVGAGSNEESAKGLLASLLAAFMIYKNPSGNGFKAQARAGDEIIRDFLARKMKHRLLRGKLILDARALASIFYLPLPFI